MQSIRSLARAAPRASARLTSTSLRTSLRPSWTTHSSIALRTHTPRLAAAAAFSTSRRTFDASATELAAKLQSELQLETEQSDTTSTASDGNVKAFFNETDWTLHDTEGEAVVKLSRKHEGELIEVRFTIADFNTPYESENESADEALMDEEEELGEGQSGGASTKGAINQGKTSGGNFKVAPEDDIAPADREDLRDSEDDSQAAFPANVNVLISHPSSPNKGALRVNLVTDSGEFRVESVTHFASADLPEAQVASQPLDTETTYAGPPFPQLDEDLQALLESYLNERGIDTNLAIFIPEYIDVKEQKEYLRWLSKVKEFVE